MAEYTENRSGMISQDGIVRAITNGYALVDIQAAGACAACQISGSCTEAKSGREIQVYLGEGGESPSNIRIGDRVRVTTETRQGLLAVLFLFIIPLILIVGGVAWAGGQGWDDAVGAGVGLGIAGIYGLVLWLLNSRIQRNVRIQIEKISNPTAAPQ
ncbi:SoxR reducing system RseC family protein [Spirochaeta lutea]|uniref:Positive regulator of sigma E activity n=1 Tax=Spirochaeta lutea TaxID=1480694 RepID=A0A098QXU1_9SPIO|nr:SoxR reducing system RseC family protein [Spirochaeta lutea]KGE72715.1 hypothetical protein DC28_06660 [Spirochaeta lutea]